MKSDWHTRATFWRCCGVAVIQFQVPPQLLEEWVLVSLVLVLLSVLGSLSASLLVLVLLPVLPLESPSERLPLLLMLERWLLEWQLPSRPTLLAEIQQVV